MRKPTFLSLLLAAVILGSCNGNKSIQPVAIDDNAAQSSEATEDDDNARPQRSDYSFATDIIMSEPDEEGEQVVENIVVHFKVRGGTETLAEAEPMPLDTINWQGFGRIHEDDINFDGYPDLMVCNGPNNNYGNFTYSAWLWNQQTRSFDPVEGFHEIFDPVIDADRKEITGGFHMDYEYEDHEVWKWKDGKITMVESERIDYREMNDEDE